MQHDRIVGAWSTLPFHADWALFLDLDGTLLDIASAPGQVAVPRELVSILARLSRELGGALALLSGRAIADIDDLLAPLSLPAAGQHGAELRLAPAGSVARLVEPVRPQEWGPRLAALARAQAGVLVEDKGLAIAVHYRAAPAAEPAVRRALEGFAIGQAGFALKHGKCVCEILPRGCDKGDALRRLMATSPFAQRVPVVLGDDVTDEDAFGAALALGGRALRVGSAEGATFPGPVAVRAWLAAGADALQWSKSSA
jgi:trehalose 6-phosphate phosphatase